MEIAESTEEDEMSALKLIFDSFSAYLPAFEEQLKKADRKVNNAVQSIQNSNSILFAYEDDEFPECEYPYTKLQLVEP